MSTALPQGILAVIRAPDREQAATIGEGLALAGVEAVEITLTVPGAIEVIERLAEKSVCAVGAGTVRTATDAELAIRAGARFLVAPDVNLGVLDVAHAHGVPYVPGALTPSEVGRCLDHGVTAIKVFPVGALGGSRYLTTLSEPFPHAQWVVSGGISIDQVDEYLDVGARIVCLGGALIDRPAAARGDLDAVVDHARTVLSQLGQGGRAVDQRT